MDQPPAQSSPPPPQARNPTSRDMMFCHECHDEWYRDQHGLTCPECGSDFTEIIEDDNDPRDAHGHGFDHDHDDDDADEEMPALEELPNHIQQQLRNQHQNQNQYADDPEEDDISNLQFRQLGPGRFAVTGSIFRTISPADLNRGGAAAGANAPGNVGGFASLLNSIVGGIAGRAQQDQANQGQQEQHSEQGQARSGAGQGMTAGGHHFTYTSSARLFPRDPNNPGPHMEPTDELNNVLVGLMAAFGDPPGGQHHHHFQGPGVGQQDDGSGRGFPPNPFMSIFSQVMGGQFGDAVYSQEALDRIISQLMDQNATSNAPGPASQDLIDTLPRKPVTQDMLGNEGHAECNICMEEVSLGEEVAELPCHHWFHHACVAAWLGEHDTCPHCRKGITKQPESGDADAQQATGSSTDPSRTMPGAFGVSGTGTDNDPFTLGSSPPPSDAAHQGPSSEHNQPQNQDPNQANAGSGLGDRIRRSWFGPS